MNYWYIDKFERGSFTSLPEQAQTVTKNGVECPVLAPGYMFRQGNLLLNRQLKIWEMLLDEMEKNYEQAESLDQHDEEQMEELLFRNVRMAALEETLAVLSYGQADEKSLELIRAQAKIRYEQEMEE